MKYCDGHAGEGTQQAVSRLGRQRSGENTVLASTQRLCAKGWQGVKCCQNLSKALVKAAAQWWRRESSPTAWGEATALVGFPFHLTRGVWVLAVLGVDSPLGSWTLQSQGFRASEC